MAVQYYDEASKYFSKEAQNAGDSLESILQGAQDAAYEYSGLLSKEAGYSKKKSRSLLVVLHLLRMNLQPR